jgi:hypothetical protein
MVLDEQIYYFKGTPPFILKEANGGVHEITQTSMPKANLTFVPVSITDKTECPGGLQEVIGTCAYTGTDWYADPEHKCQQRISGAQNWEAYIKDPRDDELYRIVQYSDGVWWWADDYRGSYGYERTCSGLRLYSATDKSLACPNGWILPSANEYKNRFTRPATNDNWGGALNPTKFCYNKDNGCFIYDMPIRCDVVATDLTTAVWSFCDSDMTINSVALTPGQIRCFHQL